MRQHLERRTGMSDAVWDRHTNPWSGWTRIAIPALFAIAIWSRVWIGWWSLPLVGLLAVWTWWNPRAFPPPVSVGNWMSRAVLGERVWLAQTAQELPEHHTRIPMLIAAASGIGLLPLAWGLWRLDVWAVVTGLVLVTGGKLWFLDRMVWLRQDTRADGAG